MRRQTLVPTVAALLIALAGCSPAQPAPLSPQSSAPGPERGPKRVLAAIRGDPHTVYQQLNPSSSIPGIDALQELVHAGLAVDDEQGVRRPQLAEAVPTLENGLWRLLPDGRMETTWRIRTGTLWQDGTPLTADDLVFTAQVVQDKDLPIFGDKAYDFIEAVEAVDSRTVSVRWRQPYIEADTMFTYSRALPIAKHLLDKPYVEDKENFIQHPYWSTEFVGAGPFKLKEWVRGSHMIMEANDRYLLGRPRVARPAFARNHHHAGMHEPVPHRAVVEGAAPEYGMARARLDQEVSIAIDESARLDGRPLRLPLGEETGWERRVHEAFRRRWGADPVKDADQLIARSFAGGSRY